MTNDEQARARLVCLANETAGGLFIDSLGSRDTVRERAGFKNPRSGSWCAAGLTAAMEDAGLVVPAPGTPARRGAVALLDFVRANAREEVAFTVATIGGSEYVTNVHPRIGDIIAWLQNKAQETWRMASGELHAFATDDAKHSMCGKIRRDRSTLKNVGERCSSCVWETRKGHVALIVAVDDESLTTVGWNEGAAPGRVMKRRLWRDTGRKCGVCKGRKTMPSSASMGGTSGMGAGLHHECRACKGTGKVPRSSTVLYRRPGGLYGVARPVAR